MSDLPEPHEDQPPESAKKTSSIAWIVVILFFAWIIVEILSISVLGTNANRTFSTISTKK